MLSASCAEAFWSDAKEVLLLVVVVVVVVVGVWLVLWPGWMAVDRAADIVGLAL